MSVDNFETVGKVEIDKFLGDAFNEGYIMSVPIEHYSVNEIKEISEKAKKLGLVISIRNETSNFYQGVLIQAVRKDSLLESKSLIEQM